MTPRLGRLLDELTSNGLHSGLQHLNGPVDHRCTGVYRLKDSVFRNIALYDKEGEMLPEFLAQVPLEDSFCQFVIRDGYSRQSTVATTIAWMDTSTKVFF